MSGMDAAIVRQFVCGLDRADRLVLMLRYAEELTAAEIAAVLELTEREVVERLNVIVRRVAGLRAGAAAAATAV